MVAWESSQFLERGGRSNDGSGEPLFGFCVFCQANPTFGRVAATALQAVSIRGIYVPLDTVVTSANQIGHVLNRKVPLNGNQNMYCSTERQLTSLTLTLTRRPASSAMH